MSADRGSTGNNSCQRSTAQSNGQKLQEYQQRLQEYNQRMQEYQQQMVEWGERMREYGLRMRGGSEQQMRECGECMRECGERMQEYGRQMREGSEQEMRESEQRIRECGQLMRDIGQQMQQLVAHGIRNNENVEEEETHVAAGGTLLLGFSDADIDRVSTTFNYVEPPEKSSSAKDVDHCSICLEPFKADECMRKLRCGHEFHSSCVVPWLRRQTTCPNCRRKIPRVR